MLERILRENALDRRTGTAQRYYGLQDALIADRGGEAHCTAAERILIERAASLALICRTIEHYVIRCGILDPTGVLTPVLAKGYTSHAMALQRTLQTLGIRPDKVERLPNVSELLNDEEAPS